MSDVGFVDDPASPPGSRQFSSTRFQESVTETVTWKLLGLVVVVGRS